MNEDFLKELRNILLVLFVVLFFVVFVLRVGGDASILNIWFLIVQNLFSSAVFLSLPFPF
jgi:hypothetical protein